MKDKLEKSKDILYNISDYLIMGAIILVISLIIVWRLDVLFPDNARPLVSSEEKVRSEVLNTRGISQTELDSSTNLEQTEKVSKDDANDTSTEYSEGNPELIKVSIPRGSPTSNIGNILLDRKLIESVDEFEQKVNELDLETALRSGDYDIETNSSLETIIKTIANKI